MTSLHNNTVTSFFLTGFHGLQRFKVSMFLFFFMTYTVTIAANFLIFVLISTSRLSESPMYFFLSNLSLCDILFSTNIVPNVMHLILEDGSFVSYFWCFLQFYIFASCTGTECYLLMVMSYDRYSAICDPLRYSSNMEPKRCFCLVVLCWSLSFSFVLITIVLLCRLQFCGNNIIDHFFCDFIPILELSCSDTSAVQVETMFFAYLIVFFPFVFTVTSYMIICGTILRISSATGRRKAFSTCSSHLTVVCTYYGSLLSVYLSPSWGNSGNMNTFLSLLFTLVTPLVNPLIYSLRNRDIKKQFNIFITKKRNNVGLITTH